MDNEKRIEKAVAPTAKTNPITEGVALAQWALLEDEYCITPDPEGMLSKIKNSFLLAIQKGRIEVCEDPNEGVIIRQFLLRSPLAGGEKTLTYKAPDVGHIATTGIGKEAERANVMRWVSLAAAVTGVSEGTMTTLKGGDRSLMETIAQLFLFV